MGFAPPEDRRFQDYPRWLLWLPNVLANGELQLTGGRGQLEVLETGAVGPAGVLEIGCVWCGCKILEAGCNQSVWGPSDRAQLVGLVSWWQGAVSGCEGPRGRE